MRATATKAHVAGLTATGFSLASGINPLSGILTWVCMSFIKAPPEVCLPAADFVGSALVGGVTWLLTWAVPNREKN